MIRLLSWLVSGFVILLVRLYQATLARFLGGQCRFTPTCSQYFIEAVRKRGAVIGTLMGLWRILRCNPFSKGGYDPVK
ncbi:MAG: membrane protein insertion efficiency factor YidD [Phycisphaerae bacterium]